MNKEKIVAETINRSELWQLCLLALLAVVAYLYADAAFAAITVVGSVLCSAYGLIFYDIGRGLASLAIVALGVGAMFGRVTWGQAVMVCTGIGLVFGALTITFALTPASLLGSGQALLCGATGTLAAIQSGLQNIISGWVR